MILAVSPLAHFGPGTENTLHVQSVDAQLAVPWLHDICILTQVVT